MGLLDALVVEESFTDQVMQIDPGCCDRYLFLWENERGKVFSLAEEIGKRKFAVYQKNIWKKFF